MQRRLATGKTGRPETKLGIAMCGMKCRELERVKGIEPSS
jgi:hypothetical protein